MVIGIGSGILCECIHEWMWMLSTWFSGALISSLFVSGLLGPLFVFCPRALSFHFCLSFIQFQSHPFLVIHRCLELSCSLVSCVSLLLPTHPYFPDFLTLLDTVVFHVQQGLKNSKFQNVSKPGAV